jgi:hypothetical protein
MVSWNFRTSDRIPDWLNLILAVCLFVSPWVLGFAGEQTPSWDAWVCAVVIGVFSIAALVSFAEWEEWVNLVVGVWLVISPWVLGFSTLAAATWTAAVIGISVVAIAAWEIWTAHHPSMPRAAT